MDSLTRLAAAQGEKEWWQETRSNPKLLKAALKSYHEEAPAMPTESKTKRPKWNILQYKETLTAASKVQFAERGKMMTRKRYLWWAQTPEGGKLTEQEAEDQWREWEGQPDDVVMKDNLGKGGAKRMRVVVDDDVDFIGSYEASKALEMRGRENKKATVEDVAGRRSTWWTTTIRSGASAAAATSCLALRGACSRQHQSEGKLST